MDYKLLFDSTYTRDFGHSNLEYPLYLMEAILKKVIIPPKQNIIDRRVFGLIEEYNSSFQGYSKQSTSYWTSIPKELIKIIFRYSDINLFHFYVIFQYIERRTESENSYTFLLSRNYKVKHKFLQSLQKNLKINFIGIIKSSSYDFNYKHCIYYYKDLKHISSVKKSLFNDKYYSFLDSIHNEYIGKRKDCHHDILVKTKLTRENGKSHTYCISCDNSSVYFLPTVSDCSGKTEVYIIPHNILEYNITKEIYY